MTTPGSGRWPAADDAAGPDSPAWRSWTESDEPDSLRAPRNGTAQNGHPYVNGSSRNGVANGPPGAGAPNGYAPRPDQNGSRPYGNGPASNGTYPNGTAANGTYPNGTAANGTYPNGSAPDGTYRNGSAANGTYRNGAQVNGAGPAQPNGRRQNGSAGGRPVNGYPLPPTGARSGRHSAPDGEVPHRDAPNRDVPHRDAPNRDDPYGTSSGGGPEGSRTDQWSSGTSWSGGTYPSVSEHSPGPYREGRRRHRSAEDESPVERYGPPSGRRAARRRSEGDPEQAGGYPTPTEETTQIFARPEDARRPAAGPRELPVPPEFRAAAPPTGTPSSGIAPPGARTADARPSRGGTGPIGYSAGQATPSPDGSGARPGDAGPYGAGSYGTGPYRTGPYGTAPAGGRGVPADAPSRRPRPPVPPPALSYPPPVFAPTQPAIAAPHQQPGPIEAGPIELPPSVSAAIAASLPTGLASPQTTRPRRDDREYPTEYGGPGAFERGYPDTVHPDTVHPDTVHPDTVHPDETGYPDYRLTASPGLYPTTRPGPAPAGYPSDYPGEVAPGGPIGLPMVDTTGLDQPGLDDPRLDDPWLDDPRTGVRERVAPERSRTGPGRAEVRRKRRRRRLLEWPVLIVFSLLAALGLRTFVVQTFFIPSESMHDTLLEGDRVLVNKLAYDFHDFNRGDVIVFARPPNVNVPDDDLIKRVVALPGERVEAHDRHVFINGRELDESYVQAACNGTADFAAVVVPPGHLWVMGDNRCDSYDSRYMGPIDQKLVVGRAFVLIWPFGRIGWL